MGCVGWRGKSLGDVVHRGFWCRGRRRGMGGARDQRWEEKWTYLNLKSGMERKLSMQKDGAEQPKDADAQRRGKGLVLAWRRQKLGCGGRKEREENWDWDFATCWVFVGVLWALALGRTKDIAKATTMSKMTTRGFVDRSGLGESRCPGGVTQVGWFGVAEGTRGRLKYPRLRQKEEA